MSQLAQDAPLERSTLITVGLPVYNSERYLAQSLESLLSQTHRDFVLIISDNASTDGTAEICRAFASSDRRIQYVRNEVNIGNPGNFNQICRLTRTKYLKWSTSDDYWAPTFLEHALQVMEQDPGVALCYPQAYLVDSQGGNPEPYDDVLHLVEDDPADRFERLLERMKLTHQHLGLIRMSCLRQTRLLGMHVGSDVNLLAELVLYGKFFELPERLFFRRFHARSGSWNRGDAKHQAAFYHASNARNIGTAWPKHRHFFAAVYRSPLPLRSKLRLYRLLSRRMRWDREDLYKEMLEFAGFARH